MDSRTFDGRNLQIFYVNGEPLQVASPQFRN